MHLVEIVFDGLFQAKLVLRAKIFDGFVARTGASEAAIIPESVKRQLEQIGNNRGKTSEDYNIKDNYTGDSEAAGFSSPS